MSHSEVCAEACRQLRHPANTHTSAILEVDATPVKLSDDCNASWLLNCSFMRYPKPKPPSMLLLNSWMLSFCWFKSLSFELSLCINTNNALSWIPEINLNLSLLNNKEFVWSLSLFPGRGPLNPWNYLGNRNIFLFHKSHAWVYANGWLRMGVSLKKDQP